MRIAAVGDLHCEVGQSGFWARQLAPVHQDADILLLAGDLTASGTRAELDVLLGELASITIPIVAVLGNHDYDDGQSVTIAETLRRKGIHHLEGSATDIDGVMFVGSMGVEGGFKGGARRRWSYAEQQLMARLRHYLGVGAGTRRVVLLHNAPILATLEGEPRDLLPVLGSSAMESAIDEAGADLIIHAHAHHGTLEGRTQAGIPVYNVALPVLQRAGYEQPYRIFEL